MRKPGLIILVVAIATCAYAGVAAAATPSLRIAADTSGATQAALAADPFSTEERSSPAIGMVSPASAPNDIDASVTISGSDIVATPAVSLATTALTGVTWVSSTTLTATVPWGLDPGVYPLTIVNPDGGSVTLPNAYTVGKGVGQWNGGNLFGGDVRQVLMKPGDPNVLYAPAYGLSGLFRTRDAGASWQYTGGDLILGNYRLAADPQHPTWLWAYQDSGVMCSRDEGDTWTRVLSRWPDGRPISHGQVYPSPSDPNVLFVGSYVEPDGPDSAGAQGLIRSANGGASWQIVQGLDGVSVEDLAFDPTNAARMVLVTRDARVHHSGDAGLTWSQAAPLPLSSIGFNEKLVYNPYVPGEVWIVSGGPDAVLKSASAALDGWLNVLPPGGYVGGVGIAFSAGSVYRTWFRSATGGVSWEPFGPVTGVGALLFDPENPLAGYVGDRTCAVQKTTDGGQTWTAANNGLAGMTCSSVDVSRSDPLGLYATFGNSAGVYHSEDGAGKWGFTQVPGQNAIMSVVRTDPTDPNRIYAIGNDSIYVSVNKGATWDDIGWNPSPAPPTGGLWTFEPDPFQPGHLLASWWSGDWVTGPGYLYASSDYGASWQMVTMPQPLAGIRDIAFDPESPGLVYIAAGGGGSEAYGTGVFKSTDHGSTWTRVDDLQQHGMRGAEAIAIATHPQHVLLVGTNGKAYRSTDAGRTWRRLQEWLGNNCLFANNDSTRLYAGDVDGLYFSSDMGNTWTRAAGAFGRIQITALACSVASGQTIIYAATNGGQAGASSAAGTRGTVRATARRHVDAGIYRRVVVTPELSLKLSGFKKGVLKLRARYTAKTVVRPRALAGNTVRFVLQKRAGKWRAVRTVSLKIKRDGACSWMYKPTKRGMYRLRATIARTATHTAARTKWRSFKVR